jgi:hypothetical protein
MNNDDLAKSIRAEVGKIIGKVEAILAEVKRISNDAVHIPGHEKTEPNQTNQSKDKRYNKPTRVVITNGFNDAKEATKEAKTKREKLREWLGEWKIAMEWAGAAVILTYTAINYCMLRNTSGQLSVMQKQLESADRPWVKVDVSIISGLSAPPLPSAKISVIAKFVFDTTNTGGSPAQNIHISSRLFPGWDLARHRAWQKDECPKNPGTPFGLTGYVLFPKDHYQYEQTAGLETRDLDLYRAHPPPNIPHLVPVRLVGCVDYTFESSPTHHQTGFMVDLGMPLDLDRLPIPRELINLWKDFIGTFAN